MRHGLLLGIATSLLIVSAPALAQGHGAGPPAGAPENGGARPDSFPGGSVGSENSAVSNWNQTPTSGQTRAEQRRARAEQRRQDAQQRREDALAEARTRVGETNQNAHPSEQGRSHVEDATSNAVASMGGGRDDAEEPHGQPENPGEQGAEASSFGHDIADIAGETHDGQDVSEAAMDHDHPDGPPGH